MNRGTVLVVEDEAIVAADLANKLGHLGYEVIGITPRGEEAVSIAHEKHPNMVLMDIRLQGRMDGVEAAAQIRRDCGLPVIYLTAHSDPATLERAKTTEPFGYILKPFEERELETAIEMARYKHEAEHRLRESEEQLRLITDATPALIGYVDAASLEYQFANREYEVWFGQPPQAVVGKRMVEVLGRAVMDQLRPHLESVLAGERVRFEIDAPYTSGARWVDAHYIPRREAGGQVTGFYELVQDITDRKRAAEALRESREQLAMALTGARMGTFEWNVRTKEILWSAYHYILLGYRPGEVAPSFEAWQQRTLPEDQPELLSKIERALDGIEEYQAEYRVRWPDGSIHWLWVMGRFLIGQRGETERMLGVTMDITERKEAEQALHEAKEKLAHANQDLERKVEERTAELRESVAELERFSYSLTHDMRAPLRAMRGFADILVQECGDCLSPTRKDYLHHIAGAADRMDHLVVDALDYSKAVRQELPLTPVNADALLRGMINSYPEFLPSEADIQIQGTLPPVRGNAAGLTQCFSNLLGNALKFVEAGQTPQVRVRAEQRSDFVRLWFEDKGIGIPKECHDRIFEMFQRVNKAYEGTGIGLALVRKVVERMGGKVGVESSPGQGSRFWLELRAVN